MMLNLGTELEAAAKIITDAGVPTTIDATALTIPGGWLTPGEAITYQLDETLQVDAELYLIVGQHGPVESLNDLGDMLAKLRAAGIVAQARPASVSLPNYASEDLPCLIVPVPLHLTES